MLKINLMEALLEKTLAMRFQQNEYFAAKKASGVRYPTSNVKLLLNIAKVTEAQVDEGLAIFNDWENENMEVIERAQVWLLKYADNNQNMA